MFELQYYGVDWLAMILTFFAVWQIGNKNRTGFILMMGGNSAVVSPMSSNGSREILSPHS
ncbi:hypothetical protein OAD57_01395 [Porticoccaceae bacterium]|nr:hypothetical protein [Porticoccaceae bacterium]